MPVIAVGLWAFAFVALLVVVFLGFAGVQIALPSEGAPALASVGSMLFGVVFAGWLTAIALACSREPRAYRVPVSAAALVSAILVLAIQPLAALVQAVAGIFLQTPARSLQQH